MDSNMLAAKMQTANQKLYYFIIFCLYVYMLACGSINQKYSISQKLGHVDTVCGGTLNSDASTTNTKGNDHQSAMWTNFKLMRCRSYPRLDHDT